MSTRKEIEWTVNENGCHIITSHSRNVAGYGVVHRNKRRYMAHRYMYEIHVGAIPEGMIVRHKCDTPACINPEHLEIGTTQDNINDMMSRNRGSKGETSGLTHLKEHQVIEILLDDVHTLEQLAEKYETGKPTIWRIKKGERWTHIYDMYKDQVSVRMLQADRSGESNGRSKLNREKVLEILKDNVSSTAELSTKYGVNHPTIRKIKTGLLWKSVYKEFMGE